jgi:hypothetical protein
MRHLLSAIILLLFGCGDETMHLASKTVCGFALVLVALAGCTVDNVDFDPAVAWPPTPCVSGATQSCYCSRGKKSGVQVCNVLGESWGACVGCQTDDVMPKDTGVDIGTAPDAGVVLDADVMTDDSSPDATVKPLSDIFPHPDTVSKCLSYQSGCVYDKIVKCNTFTGLLDVIEDCSKKNYGNIKFGCSICKGTPTCLPPTNMYSGEISKYIGYKYTYRYPRCPIPNVNFFIDAEYQNKSTKLFYHRIMTTNFSLVVAIRDVTATFNDSFYSSTSSTTKYHKVQVRLGICTNWKIGDSTVVPNNYGTVKLKFSKLDMGGSYDLSMDGLLYCGGLWKPFKYQAKGFIRSIK